MNSLENIEVGRISINIINIDTEENNKITFYEDDDAYILEDNQEENSNNDQNEINDNDENKEFDNNKDINNLSDNEIDEKGDSIIENKCKFFL